MLISELFVSQKQQELWQLANRTDAPKLCLRIKNGNQSLHNKILSINPLGLEGIDNLRQANDGFVYFGTLKHSMPDSQGNIEVLNDFLLPPAVQPTAQLKVQIKTSEQPVTQKETRHRGR